MSYQNKLISKFQKEGYTVIKLIRCNVTGIPDLMLLKEGVTKFVEVKEDNDTLKPLQRYWIDKLRKEGFEANCYQASKGIIY